MPSITLTFTTEKGLRALDAFKKHQLAPPIDPGTGQPYSDIDYLKLSVRKLVSREVLANEKCAERKRGNAATEEAVSAVTEDFDLVT